ncbi:MAG: mandelate racemase/muconate lactonizing protein [Planctomycetes bacterium]|nr:mandelate racemase/muconate lactonizing protein [Planctomycetota bacterium]
MKLTAIETIPIRVPLKTGMTTKTAHGEHIDSPYVILRVHTDEGLIGLGEATVSPRWTGETAKSCIDIIENLITPALLGSDPTNITDACSRMARAVKNNPFTKAAVEMALWDIAGKSKNCPVYELLGGRVRPSIPIKMVVGAFELEKVRDLTQTFLDWGVQSLKVKVGLDMKADLARVHTVRDMAGTDISIGIDANGGWNWATAKQALSELESLNILFAEQPIAPDHPTDLALLRQSTIIPIMADESIFTLQEAHLLTSLRACDLLSVYPGKHSGIQGTHAITHVAQAAGIQCSIGSNLELGVGTAAMIQIAAAIPTINSERFPADIIGPLYHETDLLKDSLQLGPSHASIPTGPGLGVELDDEKLQHWRA